jgi:hypothetical protein
MHRQGAAGDSTCPTSHPVAPAPPAVPVVPPARQVLALEKLLLVSGECPVTPDPPPRPRLADLRPVNVHPGPAAAAAGGEEPPPKRQRTGGCRLAASGRGPHLLGRLGRTRHTGVEVLTSHLLPCTCTACHGAAPRTSTAKLHMCHCS